MKPLTTAIALHNAANTGELVAVFIGIERIGSGIIEEITEHSVMIRSEEGNIERYMRANCSFWVEA